MRALAFILYFFISLIVIVSEVFNELLWSKLMCHLHFRSRQNNQNNVCRNQFEQSENHKMFQTLYEAGGDLAYRNPGAIFR